MLFSSVPFVFYFLPLFLVAYYLTGLRNSVLLVGSMFFYVWGEGPYVVLLLALVAFNLAVGLRLERPDGRSRLLLLVFSIIANAAVLGFFKYSQFGLDIMASVFHFKPATLSIHLPLGISFFTFQLMSYLIEVYRKAIPAERDYLKLATYVMMFPHLVAGPIVRYTDIARELGRRKMDVEKVGLGIQYFIVGLAQKVLIANTVAGAADHVFGLPTDSISTSSAWLGTFAYTLQIYFDFCGYSNMAIGLAFLLGFRFPKNFDYPYSSRSISEFWRRWHMSLSFWFRDYLYIPLGGSRFGELKTIRNLAIVFLVTGLWHGAAWNFVFWGAFHGFFVIVEHIGLKKALDRAPQFISRSYTLIVVMIGWVFFRADSFTHAGKVIEAMAGFHGQSVWDPTPLWLTPEVIAAFIAGSIFSFPIVPWLLDKLGAEAVAGPSQHAKPGSVLAVHRIPTAILLGSFVLSVMLLVSSSLNPFLYFRF